MSDRPASGKAHITIPTDGGDFPLLELQYALTTFRGLYVRAYDATRGLRIEDFFREEIAWELSEIVLKDVARRSDSYIFSAGMDPIQEWDDIRVVDLHRENPLELLVFALAVPLAAAVILSGGKFKAGPLKVELPPIGVGIERLRKSLRPISMNELHEERTTSKFLRSPGSFDL